ncbi:S8 family serine peptidase [Streptomyces sp. NPDC091204]|uniref:S8 family peptidase n=1 Tax=Streptomyces sp. NPDC091204 TaxID=3155299 RepID=UPI00341A8571
MNQPAPEGDSTAGEDLTYFPNASSTQIAVVRDPGKFTVRFGLEREPLDPDARDLLRRRAAVVERLPEHQLSVYTLSPTEAHEAVHLLNRERAVNVAAPVLHRSTDSQDDIYVTENFVAQFLPDVTRKQIDQLNAQHGVSIAEELGYAENGFLLVAPAGADGLGALRTANIYRATGLTVFAHPDLITPRHRRRAATRARSATAGTRTGPSARAVRDAGYVARQWHLTAARVVDAWEVTFGDPRIRVAVLDDGVDTGHPEFADKVGPQFDFSTQTADASPKSGFNNHGTACAGVAVAKGLRASGAAPECTLMPIRFPSSLGASQEARMFQWAADNGADVISCSWGPEDGTGDVEPLPGSTAAALDYCARKGRDGKGIPICWAAGNGNESVDDDGYASSPDVIAIAASTDRERRAWYSDRGRAIWICAPSSGAASMGEKSITTTDRTGVEGYNDGREGLDVAYTNSFGGTSSATPLVAGIVGLILSANPDLTAQQVRDILRETARKIGDGYDTDGHSPEFGYGQVDAHAAVLAARSGSGAPPVIPVDRNLSITGPESVSSSGPPPTFGIDAGPGPTLYYALEVATASRLFDRSRHGDERSPSNFYASWQDTGFLSDSSYRLPAAAWQQLHGAGELFYRAWFSSSAEEWRDVLTTTPDADHATAPLLEVEQDGRNRDVERRLASPRISGPDMVSGAGAAPVFSVELPDRARSFRVEVAAEARLLDRAEASGRTSRNYYLCPVADASEARPYRLPASAWEKLRVSRRMYYRVASARTPADTSNWKPLDVSLPDAVAERAPWVSVTSDQEPRTRSVATGRAPLRDPDELRWRRI